MMIAPAARMRATKTLSFWAIAPANSGDPLAVGKPSASDKSLIAMGIPCSHPTRGVASARSASARSSARGRSATMALTAPFTASIRSSVASIKARAVRLPFAKASDWAKAPMSSMFMAEPSVRGHRTEGRSGMQGVPGKVLHETRPPARSCLIFGLSLLAPRRGSCPTRQAPARPPSTRQGHHPAPLWYPRFQSWCAGL